MENKYYTPSIEEFHVGFEYEWKCSGTHTDWIKSVCNTSMHPLDIDCIRVNNYRVKYLDKEDIESLGFKQTIEDQYVLNGIEFLIDDDLFVQIIKDDGFLFQGTIKNKSELKRIFKMMVYENS